MMMKQRRINDVQNGKPMIKVTTRILRGRKGVEARNEVFLLVTVDGSDITLCLEPLNEFCLTYPVP